MYRALCLSLLLLALPAAAQNACLAGQWQYDTDASDNPERILKKLLRKQKQQLRQQYRPRDGEPEQDENLTIAHKGLPAFVFSQTNIELQLKDDDALMKQGGQTRQWNLSGKARPVSLNQVAASAYTQIAGWQGDEMIVETTLSNGRYIAETFRINTRQQLQSDLLIRDTLGKTFELSKYYNRVSPAGDCR